MNQVLKSLLGGLPGVLQYVVAIGIVLLAIYLCLFITRKVGQRHSGGKTYTYDDPDKCDQAVPDLFASTMFKRRPKKSADDKSEGDSEPKA